DFANDRFVQRFDTCLMKSPPTGFYSQSSHTALQIEPCHAKKIACSFVATSGVAGRYRSWATVTFCVCVNLASQSIPSWNRIVCWLKEIENLRKLLPEVSGLTLAIGKLSPHHPSQN